MVRIISPIGRFSRWGSGCGTWRFDRLWPKFASLLAISLLALNAGVARGSAYEQSAGGLVVIEAEHFDASTPRAGHEWLLKTSPGGFEGEGSMLAAPEDWAKVTADYDANSPRLDFEVNFSQTGTHYVWVLGYGPKNSSDSVHVGLDGAQVPSASGIGGFDPVKTWVWEDSGGASIDIPDTGAHTLNLWMRESGISVDRILLTTDPSFIPGPGMAESPRGGGLPTVATPTISPDGGSHTGSVTVSLDSTTTGALIYYTLDGNTPDAGDIPYGGAFTLNASATVKSRGILGGHNDSAVASADFIVTTAGNTPPELDPIGARGVTEGNTLSVDVSASDPDGPMPSLSADLDGLPGSPVFTDHGDGTASLVWDTSVGDAAGGPYSVIVTATDATDIGITDSETFGITVDAAAPGGGGDAFQQSAGGLVVIEAEHFDAGTPRAGHEWLLKTSPGGFEGEGSMLAAPEDSAKVTANYDANSPRLDYQINFTETGTHYIWVLGYGPTSSSDSVHVGLDSAEIASASGIGPFDPEDNWVWEDRGGASIEIASPGVHTLNLWMRESGIYVDRILLTTDPSFIPGPGLAESPRGSACGSAPTVEITSPVAGDFQSTTDLFVTTRTCLEGASHSGWGIRVRADGGPSAGGSEAFAYTSPWSVTLFGLALAEHVIDADVVDESGNPVAGSQTHDRVSQIGIGDGYLAIGDSVTLGVGDDDPSDDTSQDGRVTGGGFAPILNDLLSSPPTQGYPHRIINNGVGGETSAGGLQDLPGVLSANPDADRVLIMYGMNDARPWLPVPSGLGLSPGDGGYPGTYKDNLQQIVDLVNADGRAAMLAKVNIALGDSTDTTPYPDPNLGARSVLIQEYNDVVDELVADNANGINVTPPNFYSHFEVNHPTEYSDNIHPNGAGYDSMADLWFNALTQ